MKELQEEFESHLSTSQISPKLVLQYWYREQINQAEINIVK